MGIENGNQKVPPVPRDDSIILGATTHNLGWLAHVILVSALGPNPSFFLFGGLLFYLGFCWDRGLDLDLDQGF